jgi:hypothetical protein
MSQDGDCDAEDCDPLSYAYEAAEDAYTGVEDAYAEAEDAFAPLSDAHSASDDGDSGLEDDHRYAEDGYAGYAGSDDDRSDVEQACSIVSEAYPLAEASCPADTETPEIAILPDDRPVPALAEDRASGIRTTLASAGGVLVLIIAEMVASSWVRPPLEILLHDIALARGIKPEDFLRIAEIESRLNPDAYNPLSQAAGLFQFLPSTAKQYKLEDRFDPKANANAAASLLKHNAARLRQALRREPTAGEVYLAHQQGATGAIKLLTNPQMKAIDVVGRQPVLWNRGTEDMTAAQFAALWTGKFDRSP